MEASAFLIINLKIHRSVFGTYYEWVTPYNNFFLVITCSWPLIVYFQIECEIGFEKIYRHPLIWKIVSVDFVYPVFDIYVGYLTKRWTVDPRSVWVPPPCEVPDIYAGYRIYPLISVCLRLFIRFFFFLTFMFNFLHFYFVLPFLNYNYT